MEFTAKNYIERLSYNYIHVIKSSMTYHIKVLFYFPRGSTKPLSALTGCQPHRGEKLNFLQVNFLGKLPCLIRVYFLLYIRS
jgi:hypothetical protein